MPPALLLGSLGADTAKRLLFYGASGYTLAMKLVLQYAFAPGLVGRTVGFIDDFVGGRGEALDDLPILSFEQCLDDLAAIPVLVGIGDPPARAKLAKKVEVAGGCALRFYEDRPLSLFPEVKIGPGCFIGPNTYIGPRTTIGAHTQIMSNCSIGHDVTFGSFCTVCPSCTVSGHVVVEDGVLLGAGTTIVNGTAASPLRIGRGAKLWAGSVVLSSTLPGVTLAGNPAVPLRALVASARSA